MKKAIAIVLLITILLAGCKPGSNELEQPPLPPETKATEATIQTESTTIETVAVPEIQQHPMIAISLPVISEYTVDSKDNTIFYYKYQDVHLTLQEPDVADTVILDLLNRIDQSRPLAESVKEQALSDADNEYAIFPYLQEIQYTPKRIDSGVLSLFGTSYRYSGGNHPDHGCMAANYSLITGEVLTLGSILTHEESKKPLCDLVIQELDKIAEEVYLLDDYPQIVSQRFTKEASFDEDWYFTGNGLCFFFAPYEIAGYSSGIITVEIPYSFLTGIIDDAFFPPERDTASGMIQAVLHEDADLEAFSQITEVPLDSDGEMVFLYTEGAIQDLRIESGSWNDDGSYFTADATVLATYTLTPGDAIMVKTILSDTMPNLRVTYLSEGQEITTYITQSGVDGSIILQ